MATSERPGSTPFVNCGEYWSGKWTEQERALGSADEVILTVSSRRECGIDSVKAELESIDQDFDVDAVYLEDR
jgi:hypothetical protein